MVKTRHSEPNKPRLTTFVTLQTHKGRGVQTRKSPVNGYETDESDIGPVSSRNRCNIIDNDSAGDEFSPLRHVNSNNSATRKRQKATYQALCLPPRPQRHVSLPRKVRRSTRNCPKVVYDAMSGDDEEEEEEEDLQQSSPKQHQKKRRTDNDALPDDEVDMYTRVKRDRPKIKRDMYGVPIHDEDDLNTGESSEETGASEDQDDDEPQAKSYYLREHKPRVNLYEAPPIEPKSRPNNVFKMPTGKTNHTKHPTYRSPAHKSTSFRKSRKRAAFHGSSSTSSSSSEALDPSDDERRFERRKAKSMAKARQRCLPMNFATEDVASGIIRDRAKSGASLADVDPMNIDRSVTFEQVGGMGKHIRALKEMIVFPLLYPEVFDRFKIAPPRGVLFYGPPGTGKTLVARALANECGGNERKVAFFMRKGADCLSKWVGESERQLRLLFDQAYLMRPSIIFFDEIDGLAPVRSSRQDQIHSSIVSTLLALMDGLDNRGEVVVIGATNKIDAIDPALRRPGRFDREFLFPMPSVEARKQILQIHTRHWQPKLSCNFLQELAEKCVGYCGADMKALCTEAALHALRRRYPQIYNSEDKLQLDVASINISAKDFYRAMQDIVPTAQRSTASPGRALSRAIEPLLQSGLSRVLEVLHKNFPRALSRYSNVDTPVAAKTGPKNEAAEAEEELFSDDEDDDNAPTIFEKDHKSRTSDSGTRQSGGFLHFMSGAHQHPSTHRPRLLLAGEPGQAQSTHLGPAVLHHLERLPAHVLDLPALFAATTTTPEESCAQIFHEARRTCPSIIYLPHIDQWWDVISDMLRATFLTLLHDLNPTSPLLFLATSEVLPRCLPQQIRGLFDINSGEVVVMRNPTDTERRTYFEGLFLHQATQAPVSRKLARCRLLEVLPKAKRPDPRKLTDIELKRLRETEEATLRELRLFLRDVINKMARDRKFSIFAKPVDGEDVTDYYKIIKSPMDLSTMMTKIDMLRYQSVREFLDDIELICKNALEYNPDKTPEDRTIRHRACALKDTAHAIVTAELDPEFEKLCQEIVQSRHRRGELTTENVPAYFKAQLNVPDKGSKNDTNKVQMVVRRKIYYAASKNKKKANLSPWCRPSRRRRFKKVVVYVDAAGKEQPSPTSPRSPIRKVDNTDDVDSSDLETEDDQVVSTLEGSSRCSPEKALGPDSSHRPAYSASSASPVKDRHLHNSSRSSRGSVSPMKQIYNGASESDGMSQHSAHSGRSGRSGRSDSPEKKPLVVYDHNRLCHLLTKTVDRTAGYNVEKIERLYNLLSRCIYEHRRNYNKTALILDLELTVEKFTRK